MSAAPRSAAPRTTVFIRDDEVTLRVVEDFRQRARSALRGSVPQTTLEEHPDVAETLLEGGTTRDLVHCSIKVWLRNRR